MLAIIVTLLVGSLSGLSAAPSAHDWPQFNFDARHSGFNTQETIVGPQNVQNLRIRFRVALPAVADGSPVYLSGIETETGKKELLFVTTKAAHIVALDANSGAHVWTHKNRAGMCRVNNGSEPCYTTSLPAIDPDRQHVYSYGPDGHIHKYSARDGAEPTGAGWPQVATLKPFDEKGSSALSITTTKNGRSYLYAVNSGYYGDHGDY